MELTLVGTGHIFDIGRLVESLIDTRRPDLVCVELDPVRLRGLEERRRLHQLEAAGDPRATEIRAAHAAATKRLPLLYRFMARTQERLATDQGIEAGSEMLAAVDAARARQIPVATIDVDAQQLIRRAWGEMRLKERIRFAWAMMRGQGTNVEDEMSAYQEDPIAYLAQVGEQFPTLKRVLIDERDTHMARAIQDIARHKDRLPGAPDVVRIVAVVGDGHVAGILQALDGVVAPEQLEVIRIGELRSGSVPESPFAPRGGAPHTLDDAATDSVSIGFDVRIGE